MSGSSGQGGGSETWRWSAREIAACVAARTISAREVAADALRRLEAVNPAINAVVDCRPDDVLAAADAIDAALAAGEPAGPLCGVPVTIKINVDQRGFATTNGVGLQRDVRPAEDNPVVANLRAAGAVLLGRTNAPAFSYRWFTSNLLHGRTLNPRDPSLTPGGSSGGAAAAVASGIGAFAHGTDVAGSIRYPAYACGIHGLRPSVGRIPAFNAALPENKIGVQMTAVSGPIARSVGDLRLALTAMSQPSIRDPWWVPAPLAGPDVPRRAVFCLRPDGLATSEPVAAAVIDAAARLKNAGWAVEEVQNLPPLREPAELQMILWLGDGFAGMLAAAEREGEPGALALLHGYDAFVRALAPDAVTKALARRATLAREWAAFLDRYAVVLLPVSAELPFPNDLDLVDAASLARVVAAQMPMVGLPLVGVPALTVSTGLAAPGACVGVQVVARRFREDLCLLAGEAIEAGGVPPAPIDPVR